MITKYKIAAQYAKKRNLIVEFEGELINLTGKEYSRTIPANAQSPARTLTARAATDKDIDAILASKKLGDIDKLFVLAPKEEATKIEPTKGK